MSLENIQRFQPLRSSRCSARVLSYGFLNFSRRHENEVQSDSAAGGERFHTMARRDEDGRQVARRDTAGVPEKSACRVSIIHPQPSVRIPGLTDALF